MNSETSLLQADISLSRAMKEEIHLVPYDQRWPASFAAEKKRLLAFFSDSLVEIEHIGSTAVPNLSAKPIIDIIASVPTMDIAKQILGPLCGYGYVTSDSFNSRLSDRVWLLRHSGGHRTHHLHIVEVRSMGRKRALRFRDALRASKDLALSYQKLKLELAESAGSDRDAYARAKSKFVNDVVER